MKLFSPGKINLFLEIIRRREDGFHELSSHFQAISLGDTLTITSSSIDQLSCDDPTLTCGPDNLILKAADLFRRKTGIPLYLNVHLEKRIPQQAGLGGGSSNAATTLWAMNELSNQVATKEELMAWADEIGSDISFFFSQGSALCGGKGEKVIDIPPTTLLGPFWIIKPQIGLSTVDVFKQHIKYPPAKAPRSNPYFNDLEASAFALAPDLKILRQQLSKTFSHVLMTGSGTSFFCAGDKGENDFGCKCWPIRFVKRTADQWYSL